MLSAALTLALAATPAPSPCATPGPKAVTLPAGTRLRTAPDPEAHSLAVLDAELTLDAATWCGAWAEVRWEGLHGWARPGDTAGPSLERTPRVPDDARLKRVVRAMQPVGREGRLGPWRLLTDAAGAQLTALDAVASHLTEAYRARYALDAEAAPWQTVALFSDARQYKAFAAEEDLLTRGVAGHAGAGLAALALSWRPLESRVVVVHELTHLLTRTALGEAPPAWIDEGLSEDLAWCRVDGKSRLELGTLDDATSAPSDSAPRTRWGPQLTVETFAARARAGRIPALASLLSPGSRLFLESSARRDASTAAALLVRWCLAEPGRAERFRAFLRAAALGGRTDLAALSDALGLRAEDVQKDYLSWVRSL